MRYLTVQLERGLSCNVYFFKMFVDTKFKMFANTKGKCSRDCKISQCNYKFFCVVKSTSVSRHQSQQVSIDMIKLQSNNEQTLTCE